jgi:hypothetical protein
MVGISNTLQFFRQENMVTNLRGKRLPPQAGKYSNMILGVKFQIPFTPENNATNFSERINYAFWRENMGTNIW